MKWEDFFELFSLLLHVNILPIIILTVGFVYKDLEMLGFGFMTGIVFNFILLTMILNNLNNRKND